MEISELQSLVASAQSHVDQLPTQEEMDRATKESFTKQLDVLREAMSKFEMNPEQEPEVGEMLPILSRLSQIIQEKQGGMTTDLSDMEIAKVMANGIEESSVTIDGLGGKMTVEAVLRHVIGTELSRRNMRLWREERRRKQQ